MMCWRLNASRENSVDAVREKITNFVATMPLASLVVLLDEADYIPPGQAALRGVMETYASLTFILTVTIPIKLFPLHSLVASIERIDLTEFTARIATVCVEEGVEIDIDTLDSYVKATYPTCASVLICVLMNTVDGKLVKPHRRRQCNSRLQTSSSRLISAG